MELTCKHCAARFRAAIEQPLAHAVRVICPACKRQMVVRPDAIAEEPVAEPRTRRIAVIADEPRVFRVFLGSELEKLGFEVIFFEIGEEALAKVRESRAELVILNVYLKGKLGVEISEEIKGDSALKLTKVVLIGALFRANRFRANPTNLYGADEYIEEQIPAKELHRVIKKLFPDVLPSASADPDSREVDDARRLARLILSDIVIYNAEKVELGIRSGNFFELLHSDIEDGRAYYESKVPARVRQRSEFFNEVLQQFVQMKREELEKAKS